MIRINLLTVERKAAKKKVVAFQSAQKLTLGCTLILLAAGLGIADAEDLMPTAAVAVGLALRRTGDR